MKFICECGRELSSLQSYRAHRWQCKIGKLYYDKEKTKLINLFDKIFKINQDGLYECQCGKIFTSKSHFIMHIKKCELAKDILKLYEQYEELNESNKDSGEIYICTTCNRSFSTLLGLSCHCSKANHIHTYLTKVQKYKSRTHKKSINKVCHICGDKFNKWSDLKNHYEQTHYHINKFSNIFDFKVKYNNFLSVGLEIPKCKYCGENDIRCPSNRLTNYCYNPKCKSLYLSEHHKQVYANNPNLVKKARERRIKYLSDKSNQKHTAWSNRAKHNNSYLEQWFIDNIIKKYELDKHYQIIQEYPIINEDKTSAYCLDFAFMNIKLDVELDGKCHFIHGDQRCKHDIDRDKYLMKNGWKVYRISYKDITNNDVIKEFLNMLKNNSWSYNENYLIDNINELITYENYKKHINNIKKEKCKENELNKKTYYENIFKDLELNSNIDFSKFGWVNKAKVYLKEKGINITNLRRTINKYYPKFFINNKIFLKQNYIFK